jgi:hypothetical protein
MAQRVAGSKLVSAAVLGTVGVVCISAIYVPFVADKDLLRGMHEESSPPTSTMLQQEIRKLQQEGILRSDDDDSNIGNIPGTSNTKTVDTPQKKSMWGYFSSK